jgi:multidrug efflux pump subunit AcrB
MRTYVRVLQTTLRWRYVTLVAGLGLFAGSIYATALLPSGFMPDEDTSRVVISVQLPPGATLADTTRTTDRMAAELRTMPQVQSVFVLGGTSPTGQLEIRRAAITVRLVPKSQRDVPQKIMKARIAEKLADIPDARAFFVNERGERELSFSFLSRDGDKLAHEVGRIESALRQVPGFFNVASNSSLDRPEIRVVPKLDEAAVLGITPEQIAEAVRVATIGDAGANLAKFNAGDRLVPIRVQMVEQARTAIDQIEAMRLTNAAGRSIPLAAVAKVELGHGPSSIDRYDRARRADVGVDLERGFALSTARERFLAVVAEQKLDPAVWLQPAGDAEIQDEVVNGFVTAMGTGLLIVLGVLILLFGSVFQPITILLSLPLSFGGVVIALLATNNPVSMPVYIGLLMLMGIVTKNAIMLVDFAVEEIARGTDRITALIEAGRKRARPIVMTTIAMAAGMLPSAYAFGDGGEFRAPMAIAVIGGLLVSTVLSLVFVPSFFTVMDDLSRVTWRVFGRFIGPTDEPDATPRHAPSTHRTPAE